MLPLSPVLSVFDPSVTVLAPTPLSAPIVSLASSLKFAPAAPRFTAPASASALPPASARVPAKIVVAPL